MKLTSSNVDKSGFATSTSPADPAGTYEGQKSRRRSGLTRLRSFWREKVAPFFSSLQWKLTLAYTLFTVGTILVLSVVALGLLWYLNFQSSLYPTALAEALNKGVSALTPYLAQDPPDQAGLQQWLDDSVKSNYLIMNVPKDGAKDEESAPLMPGYFGEIELVTITDPSGRVLAVEPNDAAILNEPLLPQLPDGVAEVFQAALRGETDPSQLATRSNGYLTVTAPVINENGEVTGAMLFRTLSFPISASEFLQNVFQKMILPVAGIMLVLGLVVGGLFGFMISRGLTRRLRNLAQAADAWSKGNFQVLTKDTSGDELGRLARHFNHTAIQLQNLLETRQELAGLEERNRLARDLHDSVKQQVFATAMQVGAAKALLQRDNQKAKTHLSEAEQLVRQAQQELTTLIMELRPAALEGKGLAKALTDYMEDWSRQTGIVAEVRVSGERPAPLIAEQTLFRVAQEGLANIARHSHASTAEIYLAWQPNGVEMVIADDGRGFNIAGANGRGVGLKSMAERVEKLGGRLEVKSQPGTGTKIIAQLPLANFEQGKI